MIQRTQLQQLKNRLQSEKRRFIQVLFGPRQVGKTTLVSQFCAQTSMVYYSISADGIALDNNSWISQQWETSRIKLKESGKKEALLVIDEIQKIENWSELVKKEWDADTKNKIELKVILLGSSRLLLQHGLTESLAGRYESIYINHWSYNEMKKGFGLSPEEFVWFGAYPGAAELIKDEIRWKKYISDSLIETSISKDILMLTRVDKPALMKRLFELGCTYSSQILSYSKIVGQLQDAGNTTTIAHYLQLLDSAGLLGGIEKFSPQLFRQRSSSPKFQVHNTSLMTALQPKKFDEVFSQPDLWGRWVESAIGAHLLNASIVDDFNLFYWRHRTDEIDFVLEKNGTVIALEVKSGLKQKAKGMDAFNKTFKPKKLILIGDAGIKWQEFLTIDPKNLF